MRSEKPIELLKLIEENPDLPVVPFVDGEIAADDSGFWEGSWGECKVDEYIVPHDGWNPVQFRSWEDVMDTLEACLSDEEWDELPESEKDCWPYYEALPWKKAIIVYINMPDE